MSEKKILEEKRKTQKLYYQNNKSKFVESCKLYYEKNREKILNYARSYYLKNKESIAVKSKLIYIENKVELYEYHKKYIKANPDKIRVHKSKYRKKRLKQSIQFRIQQRLRKRVHSAIKNLKQNKLYSITKAIGCNSEELKKYLESKFLSGMTWDNHGLYGWHIDHVKPLSSFDLTNEKEFFQACHYTNLQPLWAKDNLQKGSKDL
jgi:hypothetical protein